MREGDERRRRASRRAHCIWRTTLRDSAGHVSFRVRIFSWSCASRRACCIWRTTSVPLREFEYKQTASTSIASWVRTFTVASRHACCIWKTLRFRCAQWLIRRSNRSALCFGKRSPIAFKGKCLLSAVLDAPDGLPGPSRTAPGIRVVRVGGIGLAADSDVSLNRRTGHRIRLSGSRPSARDASHRDERYGKIRHRDERYEKL